jgi:hypothetical protein
LNGGNASRVNGLDVKRMKAKNAAATEDCTARTRAFRVGGRFCPNQAAQAPNSVRISTQSRSEPSWFPQTPVTL